MRGVVTATGMKTYFGKTAQLVETAVQRSHFQKAVLRIGNFLILMTLGLVALILMVALFRGNSLINTLLFALILTVAAIPVALPAVLSVTMAVGASKLAAMKAIVSRLVSIEEMAGMDILCSDKTGTLTKNELTLGDLVPLGGAKKDALLLAAALTCERDAPDAIDAAVLKGVDGATLAGYKIVKFTPFDPVHKLAEAQVEKDGQSFRVAKGAPQVMLDLAKPDDGARASGARRDRRHGGARLPHARRRRDRRRWQMAVPRTAAAVRPAARGLRRDHRDGQGHGAAGAHGHRRPHVDRARDRRQARPRHQYRLGARDLHRTKAATATARASRRPRATPRCFPSTSSRSCARCSAPATSSA